MRALVWHPDGSVGPGSIREVDLPVLEVRERGLVLEGLEVDDVRPERLLIQHDLCFDHSFGGGPLASAAAERQARAFGVVNTAYHLRRGIEHLTHLLGHNFLLGHNLPPLKVKVGIHGDQKPGWGGGHYRLPAEHYSDFDEAEPPVPTGEIHLGPGGRFLKYGNARYFHAPSHNAAIIYHELGHHLCRHTADFRLSHERPSDSQHNRKIPLDEGTCDYFTAVLVNTPDIFGWHRADYPSGIQERRRVDGEWTMASFWGQQSAVTAWGEGADPHIDGTIWSAALWAARAALEARGIQGEIFDRLVAQALFRLRPAEPGMPRIAAMQWRRSFARFLRAIVEVDRESGAGCTDIILHTFGQRGITAEGSNEELRDRCRTALTGAMA